MPFPLLAATPAALGTLGAGGAAAAGGAGAGGLSLMGAGIPSLMGGAATAGGLGSMGAGLAPELGGAATASNPLSALSAPNSQGGLMDMSSLMAPRRSNKGKKYDNAMVDQFVQQGMQAPDMSQPTDLIGLMRMLGGQ